MRAEVSPPNLLSPWVLEPVVTAGAAVAAALFVRGFVRLRRRGRADLAPWSRAVLFAAGLGLGVLALVSPLDELGDRYLLSAHMLQHMLIGDGAVALVLVALRGPLLFFCVPVALLRAAGHSHRFRAAAAAVLRPGVALVAWAAAFGVWHVPAAYDYAAAHTAVHRLEHLSFVLAGTLVWMLLIDPARRRHLTRGRRLALAAAVFALGTVVADTLIFTMHPLYPGYAAQAHRVFGLSPLQDQRLAGIVMTAEQMLTLGTCAALLLLPELRRRRATRRLVGAGQPA
jgi:cytochrome c oxidase assembly factor CtaG